MPVINDPFSDLTIVQSQRSSSGRFDNQWLSPPSAGSNKFMRERKMTCETLTGMMR